VHTAKQMPLAGRRICMVYEFGLTHATRLLAAISALEESGASVQIVTTHCNDAPEGIVVTSTIPSIPASEHPLRPLRIASNLMRNSFRPSVQYVADRFNRPRILREIARNVDAFWVIDSPALPDVMKAASTHQTAVIYETIDLVPESEHRRGRVSRTKMLSAEGRYICDVDGFITAGDTYADYFVEQYGATLHHRPVVVDNMPGTIVEAARPTARPLRLLFMGNLGRPRPIYELIQAMAVAKSKSTLTFIGASSLGDGPEQAIAAAGLTERVSVLPACGPEDTVRVASQYDFGVVALRGSNDNECRATPAKLCTYMAAGLAIIGSDLPGIARIVAENSNGILVDRMEPGAWAEVFDACAELPLYEIDAMRAHSLEGALKRRRDLQMRSFIAEFEQALAR